MSGGYRNNKTFNEDQYCHTLLHAAQVNTTRMLESLQTESSDVQSFFESMNLNSTAFAELGTVMGGLGGDEAELQDYFQLLFNSSEATALLVASVGSDGAAQQAVTDALDGNTEVRGCVCGCVGVLF